MQEDGQKSETLREQEKMRKENKRRWVTKSHAGGEGDR